MDTKTVRDFTSACRSAYANRGIDTVEHAVVECSKQCIRCLGEDAKIEGMSTTAMPDQTVLVTVLASCLRQEQVSDE